VTISSDLGVNTRRPWGGGKPHRPLRRRHQRPTLAADATAVVTELKAKVPNITATITVTEELDSNMLLGRPNQYVSSAWIADSGGTPGETGSDNGAVKLRACRRCPVST
jgi:hypothetical protein